MALASRATSECHPCPEICDLGDWASPGEGLQAQGWSRSEPGWKEGTAWGGVAQWGRAWQLSPDCMFADCISAPASSQGTSDTVPDAGIDEDV